MKILTKQFGELEVEDKEIIEFKTPILGFDNLTKFTIIRNGALGFLQSLEDISVSFVVTNPYEYYSDYQIDIDDSEIEKLHINSQEDVMVLSIVTIPDSVDVLSINLISPIIINYQDKLGSQIVLSNPKYNTKHMFYRELKEKSEQNVAEKVDC